MKWNSSITNTYVQMLLYNILSILFRMRYYSIIAKINAWDWTSTAIQLVIRIYDIYYNITN